MKTKIALLSVLAVPLMAAVPMASSARAATPYVIDVVMPLTGGAAFLGKGEQRSLQLAEKGVNASGGIDGDPLQLVFHDDESNPQTSVLLTSPLVAKKPAVILGSSLVASCRAMAPLMDNGPVEYCFSPGIHPAAGSYVFSASPSTTSLLEVAEHFFHARGWTKVAVITSTDATGQDADRGIRAAFEAPGTGETIVDWQHFNPTDVSVTAQMTHIQASGAQAVIAWSTGTPFATLLRGAHDVGLTIPMLTTSGNLTYAQMNDYQPFMSKQLYFPAFPWVSPDQVRDRDVKRAVAAYIDAFKASGIRPDVGQSLAWDATLLVVDALRHLGPNATATQIRDYLAATGTTHAFVGIYGKYDFKTVPQRGLDVSAVEIARWVPEKTAWVSESQPGGTL